MRALPLLAILAACDSSTTSETDTDAPVPDGKHWSLVAEGLPGGVMLGAHNDGGTMIIAGGHLDGAGGTLWRYDGDTLCVEENAAEDTLWWIHGARDGEWYAVGPSGIVLHSKDGIRTREDLPTGHTLFGVWDDGTDVWAVGGDVLDTQLGQVWRRETGGTWALVEDGLPGLMFKVWEDWYVGNGIARVWDGGALVDRTPPEAPRLLTVRGRGPDDVFAVGGLTTARFVHWDGSGWSSPELDPRCVGQPLNGVWTAPGDDVYVAGNFGTAARWDGAAWDCAEVPLTADHFHAAWTYGDDVFALGGDLFRTGDNHATMARYGTGALTIEQTPPCP